MMARSIKAMQPAGPKRPAVDGQRRWPDQVKHKRIKSALRNFAHSFVGLTNYTDDVYVIDVLSEVLADVPGAQLEIHFPEGRISPRGEYPVPLQKSVAHFANRFEQHLASEGVDAGTLRNTRIVVFGDRLGLHFDIRATDDRGADHEIAVR